MKNRGVTLVEMMVGSLVVFAAAVTMATVVAASSRYLLQERNRSLMVQRAWVLSNSLMASWSGFHYGTGGSTTACQKNLTIGDGQGPWNACAVKNVNAPYPSPLVRNGMDPPCSICNCNGGYAGDGGGIAMTEMVVQKLLCPPVMVGCKPLPAPCPPVVVGQILKHQHPLRDVTPDLFGKYVAFTGNPPYNNVHIYDVKAHSLTTLHHMPLFKTPCQAPGIPEASSLAVYSCGCSTYLTTVDPQYLFFHTIQYPAKLHSPPANASWEMGLPPPLPDGGGDANGFPAGLVTDATGTTFYCVDSLVRGLWQWARGTRNWTHLPSPSTEPLQSPSQLAYDTANDILWLTDQGDIAIRGYGIGGGTGSPWTGILRAPEMGSPRGIAVDSQGKVYTADALHLWVFSAPAGACGAPGILCANGTCPAPVGHGSGLACGSGSAWSSIELPPGLRYQVNSMHFDPNNGANGVLWIDTDGQNSTVSLWSFPLPVSNGTLCQSTGFIHVAAVTDRRPYPKNCCCPAICQCPPSTTGGTTVP